MASAGNNAVEVDGADGTIAVEDLPFDARDCGRDGPNDCSEKDGRLEDGGGADARLELRLDEESQRPMEAR